MNDTTAKQPGAEVPLIPRQFLFEDMKRRSARVSPDGKRIVFIAPLDGVANLWVGPSENLDAARPVTEVKDWNLGLDAIWLHSNRHLIYFRQHDGDENWQVHCVDLETGECRPLAPGSGIRSFVQQISWHFPTEILVAHNARDRQLFDLYRVDVLTGNSALVEQNDGFTGFITDVRFNIRLATRMLDDGGVTYFAKDATGGWQPYATISAEDAITTRPADYSADGTRLYWLDSRGRDKSAIVEEEVASRAQRILAADEQADIAELAVSPQTGIPIAAASYRSRKEWHVLDPAYLEDKDALSRLVPGDLSIESVSQDTGLWVIGCNSDVVPGSYYSYDRATKKVKFLFSSRPDLDAMPLVETRPVTIRARDGLTLTGYLNLPPGMPANARHPTVLTVHGGPWSREVWEFSPTRQWLANRGYAVLGVNFRGSTGLGKAFVNAGNREWGCKMHDDLIDTVDWAIAEGISDPARIAIFGSSYGGYAALLGLTLTPEKFACGVSVYGIANLVTMLQAIPEYWHPLRSLFLNRVGDYTSEAGRERLLEQSPITHVDRICRPLLIGQGANDVRVKPSEAQQIVDAMKQRSIPVTYVYYPDEGHGFRRPANRLSFLAVAEAFLAQHLGGRFEPPDSDFMASSIEFKAGRELIKEFN